MASQLSNDQMEISIALVSELEIVMALKGIGDFKSLGLDGSGAYFFK